MNVGDEVVLQVSASKTMAATVAVIVPDRHGKDQLVFRLANGSFAVMPDTPHTARVIVGATER